MIEDFKTVVWKEWREHILQYGSVVKWLLSMALLIGVVGIFLPLQFGRTAVDSVFLLTWMWMPLLVITNQPAAPGRACQLLQPGFRSEQPGRAGAHTQGTLIWRRPCCDSPAITR
jgi:hypothetical protein